MKIFGIELIPWQVAFLQQWGLLPGGKSAGVNVHERTKIEGVHGPEAVHFDERAVQEWTPENSMKYNGPPLDGSENDPHRQYPPLIPQEVWDAALNPEPTHQVPPAFDAKQSKPLTYPMDFPDDFFTSRETPSLTPPVDEATTQRALDYIKAGQGQTPYTYPGYDDVYREPARGLFQFLPGTFDTNWTKGGPMTPTIKELPVDVQEANAARANAANLRKRNRNQRNALRQLNKAMVNKLYQLQQSKNAEAYYVTHADNLQQRIALDAELHERQVKELQTTIDRLNRTVQRVNDENDRLASSHMNYQGELHDEMNQVYTKLAKLKARNKKLRRKLGRLDG